MTLLFFLGTLRSDDKSRTARPIYFHVFFSLRLMLCVKYVIKAREFIYSFDKIKFGSAIAANLGSYPLVLIQAIFVRARRCSQWQSLHGAGDNWHEAVDESPNKGTSHPQRAGALQAEAKRRHPR